MDSSGLLSQAGSVTLSKTQTPMDSAELFQPHPRASDLNLFLLILEL